MVQKRERKNIERELPPVGTVLLGKFKKSPYKAKIIKDKNSKIGRAIKYDGNIYPSMTAAAEAITKQSTNGWRFWRF